MKPAHNKSSLRRLAPWAWFLATICLALGIAVFTEIIAHNHNQRLDLTPSEDFSLASQTKQLLAGLNGKLEFITFYKGGNRSRHEAFYRLLQSASPRVDYRLIHLDGNPAQAKLHGVSAYGQTIIKLGDKQQLIKYPDERAVLNALIRLTTDRVKRIYFSLGHGEQRIDANYSALANTLRNEGWEVAPVNLALAQPTADAFTVLVIAAPQKDFLETEMAKLAIYLQSGGNLVFMFEPFSGAPRLEAFLKAHGVALGHDIIIDQASQVMGDDGLAPLIPLFAKSPITAKLTAAAVFPSVGSIVIRPAPDKAVDAQYLAMSAKTSWATRRKADLMQGGIQFEDAIDAKGPLPVAGMLRLKTSQDLKDAAGARMVLFGDSDFLSNSFLDLLANKDLFLNTVNWLVKDEALISIRKSGYKYPHHHLTGTQATWIFLITVVLVPLAVMLIGAISLGYRKWRG